MSLLERIKKNSTVKESNILDDSILFKEKDITPTAVPALNIALSGQLDGGISSGFTMFAGPSKHFKTCFSLLCAKAYMDKYEDAVLIFYDSEFGTPEAYFKAFKIDTSRVIHTPITDVEIFKTDIMNQLKEITRGDRVMIVVDSIGNMASKKEIDDAEAGKSVADMTRAKQLKSVFRMITPHLTMKNIPMIAVNHTYDTLEMFSKQVVGGGKGSYYAADNIYIIGRQQDKEGTDLAGYNFIINVEKSRFTKEKSKIPVLVKFDGGISKWSGLLDIALEAGWVTKPGKGRYAKVDVRTGEVEEKTWTEKKTYSKEFWESILGDKDFHVWVANRYKVSNKPIISDDEIDSELDDVGE